MKADLTRTPLHKLFQTLKGKRIKTVHSDEGFQNTARVLIEHGRHDPMAKDEANLSPLHIYQGPVATIDYIINQQDLFYIDLDEETKSGNDVVKGIMMYSFFHGPSQGIHLARWFWEKGISQPYWRWSGDVFGLFGASQV